MTPNTSVALYLPQPHLVNGFAISKSPRSHPGWTFSFLYSEKFPCKVQPRGVGMGVGGGKCSRHGWREVPTKVRTSGSNRLNCTSVLRKTKTSQSPPQVFAPRADQTC